MRKTRCCFIMVAVMVLISVPACTENNEGGKGLSFEQQPEIIEIKPQRPVNIKLKRSTTGKYSWDLSGNDAEKVLEADKKLREELEK